MKVAVIGGGAAGVVAAWGLQKNHDITLYEASPELGGHVTTMVTDCPRKHVFDNGFVVFCFEAYPVFTALLKKLGIGHSRAKMSLSISGGNNFAICEDVKQLVMANHIRLLDPRAFWLVASILRFHHIAKRDLKNGAVGGGTIFEYLQRHHFGERFFTNYAGSIASAIWVCPPSVIRNIPAINLLKFFDHHNILSFRKFKWFNVKGGAIQYINALVEQLAGKPVTNCAIRSVTRGKRMVTVEDEKGNTKKFDQVIFACPPDVTLRILKNQTREETDALSAIKFIDTRTVCHKDPALMPENKGLWSSWNCLYEKDKTTGEMKMSSAYYHNRLTKVDQSDPVFLSINPHREPRSELKIRDFDWRHFLVDHKAIKAQDEITRLNGKDRIWYIGAWRGYGFHEDAVGSGLDVARSLGCEHADLPQWQRPDW